MSAQLGSGTELALLQLAARLHGDTAATDALRRQVRRAHFEATSSEELEEAVQLVLRKWLRKEARAVEAAAPKASKSSAKAHRSEGHSGDVNGEVSVKKEKKSKKDKKDKKDKKKDKKEKKEKKSKKSHRAEEAGADDVEGDELLLAGAHGAASEAGTQGRAVSADALAAAMDLSDSDDGGDADEGRQPSAAVPADTSGAGEEGAGETSG